MIICNMVFLGNKETRAHIFIRAFASNMLISLPSSINPEIIAFNIGTILAGSLTQFCFSWSSFNLFVLVELYSHVNSSCM